MRYRIGICPSRDWHGYGASLFSIRFERYWLVTIEDFEEKMGSRIGCEQLIGVVLIAQQRSAGEFADLAVDGSERSFSGMASTL